MLGVKKILLLSAVMCLMACQGAQPAADTEFVALDQERGYWWSSPPFLIKKVHRPQWRIAYGFADNNRCGNRFSGRYGKQLRDSISANLRVWLGSLTEQTNIVDNFSYELRRVRYSIPRPSFGYGWFEAKPDLGIIFYCQRGRAFMQTKPYPILHMLQASDLSDHNRLTTLRLYRASTLLHEIGHAFGLGDTYIDKSRRVSRFNRSTGGASTTTGKQPISVMNHHRHVALTADDGLQLTSDDRDGMQWLYARYISKQTRRRTCPFEYRRERTTKGCSPVYTLIHAVKQRNWTVVQVLLRDDKSIDINAQDKLGNTALHYAAQATGNAGSDLYLYLVAQGADDSLRNRDGNSAADLRRQNKTTARTLAASIVAELQRGATGYAAWLLAYAVRKHDKRIAQRALQDSRTYLGRCDQQEMTLLQHAALGGHTQVLRLLLQQPAVKVNQQCASGNTALHAAVNKGRVEASKLLLAQPSINANIKNFTGDTPHSLVLARLSQHRSNIKLRQQYEAVEAVINAHLDACVQARKPACLK